MSSPDPEVLYAALRNDPRMLRRLQYRCPARCLLLDALGIGEPEGILLHQNGYKLSPARNERRSSEAGRRANTRDGANHWKASTFYFGNSALSLTDAEGAVLDLQCDHIATPLRPSQFRADWDAGHAEMRMRADGSRYSVG